MDIRKQMAALNAIVLILLLTSNISAHPVFDVEKLSAPDGYTTVMRSGDSFIAATTRGRIDWISASGEITRSIQLVGEKLTSLLTRDEQIIAAGDNSTLMFGSEKEVFKMIDHGRDGEIYSLASFKEKIIAGCNEGALILLDRSGGFENIQLALKGNIVSLSSNNTICYGVSDKGEIIHSLNGKVWEILDFNQMYSGYYKSCSFNKVTVSDDRIAIIGKQSDGLPVLYFSSRGAVWTKRELIYSDDQGRPTYLEDTPNDIFYDHVQDRYIMVCDNGIVMIIPSCEHCNQYYVLCDKNLTGISGNEKKLIFVGEEGYLKMIDKQML